MKQVLLAALVLVLPDLVAPLRAQPRRQPSVLFYLIDTCRADRLSVYGNERRTTPFLEDLAKRSIVFEQCYAHAPWTKPSMAALLTSRYPSEVGIHQMFQRLASSHVTFPEVLKDGGYHTAGFSANPLMGGMSNYTQGFVHFTESIRINRGDPIRFASGSAEKLNGRVFSWLDDNDAWPVFLYVHSVDPHEEYEPAEEYLKQFADPAKMDAYRADWRALLRTRPPIPGNRVVQWNFDKARVDPGPFIEQGLGLYDADILANDVQIERLWKRLQAEGWGEDVILVLTSDHGEEFFEHGGTCHGYSLYDELVHVPLLIYAPRLFPEGQRVDRPVRTIDIYPTLLDLLGLEAPDGIRGRSLVPLMRDAAGWADEPVFAEMTEDATGRRIGGAQGVAMSVRSGRWKFVLNLGSPVHMTRARHELFDVVADPGEKRNVAGAHPDLVERFEREVMQWSAENLGLRVAAEEPAGAPDPETLERLRQLGYVGAGAGADAAARSRPQLPVLVRAVLEGDRDWDLLALDPSAEPPHNPEHRFSDVGVADRGKARGAARDDLLSVLYEAVEGTGEGTPPPDRFEPRHGLRAEHGGHTADLVLDMAGGVLRVYLDAVGRYGEGASPLATFGLADGCERAVLEIYRAAGL